MKDDDEKRRLFNRIARRALLDVVLERMRLHGFWPTGVPLPPDPPDEAAERARLEKEMAELRARHAIVKDPDQALAEERKRRWEASKQRRAEAKARREAEAAARRARWEATRRATIVHAGEGVSAGLARLDGDRAALLRRGLPLVESAAELAAALGIPLSRLRWLTYHRRALALVHYHRYGIPKVSGGIRSISAPKAALAAAQRWVLEQILERLEVEPQAHGFVAGRSIVTNAAPHLGRRVVVNLDLESFFPTITFRRVQGLFHALGYSGHVATVLSLLTTEPPRAGVELDGRVYRVALSERVLPQGACTSPAITNALCRRLDRRLIGVARRFGAVYTRYADDLTFSMDDAARVGELLGVVRGILRGEGFRVHEQKTHVMRAGGRQEVTGVVVNQRTTRRRDEVRQLRAILHNVARHGLESQNRDGHPRFEAHLRGKVEFLCMVDPAQAPKLRAALVRALDAGAR
jgi:retron-type reverse transcriptase